MKFLTVVALAYALGSLPVAHASGIAEPEPNAHVKISSGCSSDIQAAINKVDFDQWGELKFDCAWGKRSYQGFIKISMRKESAIRKAPMEFLKQNPTLFGLKTPEFELNLNWANMMPSDFWGGIQTFHGVPIDHTAAQLVRLNQIEDGKFAYEFVVKLVPTDDWKISTSPTISSTTAHEFMNRNYMNRCDNSCPGGKKWKETGGGGVPWPDPVGLIIEDTKNGPRLVWHLLEFCQDCPISDSMWEPRLECWINPWHLEFTEPCSYK